MREQTAKDDRPAVTPELIERARAKDREAMTALYEATSLEIYRTIHALIKDEDLTLDVQQDTYLQAFSRLDQLREPEAFLPWLRRIAVNEARTALRRKRPLLFSEIAAGEEGEEPELPEIRPVASPELELDRKETSRLIREILSGLSDGQRMLLGMFYYEQIPIQKIAEDTGLSPGTVKSQLFRGRRKVETAVKRLEEQGVKLYGLSPLPFLLALLKKQSPAAETGKTLLADTLTRAGAAPLAETAAVHVGRSFFQTALGRVVLGLIAAGAIGGGIAGYSWARDNILIGDVRTPTSVETAEDLTTEPVTRNDSEEDLFPEPSTVATEPTEITTEPIEITTEAPEITTEPGESPTEPTEPPTEPDPGPAQPGQPTPTEPQPTQPGPTEPQPTQPGPTEPQPTQPSPTEPQPTQPTTTELTPTDPTEDNLPRVVSCSWGNSDVRYDQPWGSSTYIKVVTENGGEPWLYTDNENVVQLRYDGKVAGAPGQTNYSWLVTFIGSGTAHIYCEMNWEVTHVLTVNNPEYPEMILSASCSSSFQDGSYVIELGNYSHLNVLVQGMTKPTVYTDNAAVVDISYNGLYSSSQTSWIHRGHYYLIAAISPGTAHIYVELNGSLYQTFTVTVPEKDAPTEPTEEETSP